MLERLQAIEYARYAREIARDRARARVLTGTGSLFRVGALRAVAQGRFEGRLPGVISQVYDTTSLTEDNELTLALKHLGYRCVSPKTCVVRTDVMPTLTKLFHQRLRWQRGAIENLRAYGLTRVTLPYLSRQLLMALGVWVNLLFFFLIAYSIVVVQDITPTPFYAALTGLFVFERAWTVRRLGPHMTLIAATLVLEMTYAVFQQFVYVRAGWNSVRARSQEWVIT